MNQEKTKAHDNRAMCWISKDLRLQLKIYCAQAQRPMCEVANEVLGKWLKEQKK